MRKVLSADSIIPKINEKKVLYLIKRSQSRGFNKIKTSVLLGGSVLLVYSNIYNDITVESVGSVLTTCYFSINLGFNYVENYLNQLDIWREEEAEYEEKNDPPEWNWKIINHSNHFAIVFNLLSCISIDLANVNDMYFYIGNGLQLIGIFFKLKNKSINEKIILTTGMNIISVLFFVLNKIYSWTPLVIVATYISVFCEIIEI